jgi:hypothetical protein
VTYLNRHEFYSKGLRPDRNPQLTETRFTAEANENYQSLNHDLKVLMHRFFPKEAGNFKPPTLERIQENFRFIAAMFAQKIDINNGFDRAFLVCAAVRYVDDFIDQALWPSLQKRLVGGEDLLDIESRFSEFLESVYAVAGQQDAYLPKEILNLPKLELHLLLHPDQATFDDHFADYFFYKSFNLAYVEHVLTRERSAEPDLWTETEKAKFLLLAAWDVSRDLYTYEESTDFDMFKYIRAHNLDPSKMTAFIEAIIENAAPVTYQLSKTLEVDDRYSLWLSAQDEGLDRYQMSAVMGSFNMLEFLKAKTSNQND